MAGMRRLAMTSRYTCAQLHFTCCASGVFHVAHKFTVYLYLRTEFTCTRVRQQKRLPFNAAEAEGDAVLFVTSRSDRCGCREKPNYFITFKLG